MGWLVGTADRTNTRSLMAMASSRSSVMNRTALFSLDQGSRTPFSISCRVWMASAENGSSMEDGVRVERQRLR